MSRPKKPTTNEPAKGEGQGSSGRVNKRPGRPLVHPERTDEDGQRGRLSAKMSDTQRQALISALQGGVGRDLACKQLDIPWLVFDRTYKDPKEAEFKKQIKSAERSAFQTLEIFGNNFATADPDFLLNWLDRKSKSVERTRYWENQAKERELKERLALAEMEVKKLIAMNRASVDEKQVDATTDLAIAITTLADAPTDELHGLKDKITTVAQSMRRKPASDDEGD